MNLMLYPDDTFGLVFPSDTLGARSCEGRYRLKGDLIILEVLKQDELYWDLPKKLEYSAVSDTITVTFDNPETWFQVLLVRDLRF